MRTDCSSNEFEMMSLANALAVVSLIFPRESNFKQTAVATLRNRAGCSCHRHRLGESMSHFDLFDVTCIFHFVQILTFCKQTVAICSV